jgi:hypothetical protein
MTDILDLILSTPRLLNGLSVALDLPLYKYGKPGFDGVKCRRSQEQIPMPADEDHPRPICLGVVRSEQVAKVHGLDCQSAINLLCKCIRGERHRLSSNIHTTHSFFQWWRDCCTVRGKEERSGTRSYFDSPAGPTRSRTSGVGGLEAGFAHGRRPA